MEGSGCAAAGAGAGTAVGGAWPPLPLADYRRLHHLHRCRCGCADGAFDERPPAPAAAPPREPAHTHVLPHTHIEGVPRCEEAVEAVPGGAGDEGEELVSSSVERRARAAPAPAPAAPWDEPSPVTSSGAGGRRGALQLWQFLVLLLGEGGRCAAWTGRGLEFKLHEPEEVARRWGASKNRPAMNYDKLSRSLRYYYEKGIVQKVAGERYVYRFVCDPRALFAAPPAPAAPPPTPLPAPHLYPHPAVHHHYHHHHHYDP